MIIDTIDHLDRYEKLHPLFARAIEYLKTADLNAVPPGSTVELRGSDLTVGFSQTEPREKQQARLETHKKYIDIQIPLSDVETIGYTPLANLPESVYDPDRDITFYEEKPADYLTVNPGMFVIFWPQDAHAPGISGKGVRKIVVKVRV